MRIIYVTPHLSTGGMPEYLRRKVELLKDDHDVWVVEKHFEPAYRTIRDKIESMIGDRLVNIGENHFLLIDMIKSLKPDVVHFEELSDYHFRERLLEEIYTEDREYLIFDTLHDSSIDHTEKRFMPDKMLVVSPWQVKNFMDLGIPVEMLEHEIIPGERDRTGLHALGLDTSRTHVLQVGLFSRRKNQSETIEIARMMPDVDFHFVGSQTENYKDYWQPLLEDLPPNCRIWGERSDVETFYACMDCVIFPSRGDYGDRETNPLVIREAIAWNVPLFVRNRDFYMGMYSESSTVRFMHDDTNRNVQELRKFIKKENIMEEITEDLFKGKLFDIEFVPQENKIEFKYLGTPLLETKICVRDIDTEVPIYTFDARFGPGSAIWCIPIPKGYYDFQNNPNFGGFLYDFYVGDERKYTCTTRIKAAAIRKEKFRVETFEPIFVNYEQFFTDKIYDEFMLNATNKNHLQELPSQIGTVVDIGSNVGLFTELALRKGASRVFAAEINDNAIETFEQIHGEDERVKLVKVAIYGKDGEVSLNATEENSLTSSVSEGSGVPAMTLGTFLEENGIDQVGLLKVDVEGAEYSIFDGTDVETLKKIDSMIVEFHENWGGRLRDSIISKLNESGHTYFVMQDDCKNPANEWETSGTIFASKI